MQTFVTLVRRELGAFFVSLTGYAVMAGVLFLFGFSMVLMLESLNATPAAVPIVELFYETAFFWLIVLLAAPVITMRSFALERASGTYETLMTTPVSDLEVVLAKFTGNLIFFLITWLPLLAYPLIIKRNSAAPEAVATGPLSTTFLGIFLLGCLYMSMGIFASSLTRNQILAAMNAFGMGLCLFFLSFVSKMIPLGDTWLSKVASHVSMFDHMLDFVRGVVDTRHITFYVSLTALFLYLTLKVVESRRWK
ncbi:MAG: gliding motility protein GldF [Verrucomicrobia bacterium]|nr:gliding motility protein GldF [Verrucomicrobiota bacterium]